jgi:hypothetical protein
MSLLAWPAAVVAVVALGVGFDRWFGARDRLGSAEARASPVLAEADGFNRADQEGLTRPDNPDFWQTDGVWNVVGGQAKPTGPAVALTRVLGGPGAFEVQVRDATPGTAVVFRWEDANNHWRLRPLEDGPWVIERMENGRSVGVTRTADLLGFEDVRLLVEFNGDEVLVRSQGRLQCTVVDATFVDADQLGFSSDGVGTPTFDNAIFWFPPPSSSTGDP